MHKKIARWVQDKESGIKRAVVTAYDYPLARLAAEAGVHGILVGDSLGMVVGGGGDTLGVTLEQMAYHTGMVVRGAGDCLVFADLPFGSYEKGPEQAWAAAVTLLRAGADVVKLEGGAEMASTVAFCAERGINICAHIGLTPQRVRQWGSFQRQGTDADSARRLQADAGALADAGARFLVLEAVPDALAANITRDITIPTIGIGAGPDTDAQVLVIHDLLGLGAESPPFARRYIEGGRILRDALAEYVREVGNSQFPPRRKR